MDGKSVVTRQEEEEDFVYIISRLCSRKYNLDVFLNLVIDT